MRSMGTMLFVDFQKYGVWGSVLRRPIEFLMFRMKKNFFVMTDDGTHGDKVYEKWKPSPEKYKFCFWKTGIDIKSINEIKPRVEVPKHEYLFFAARFDGWKRHDRVLKILHLLHQKERKIHLYLAGNITYNNCYDDFRKLVQEYGLDEYVHFLGAIRQDDVKFLAYHAVANPLMYDVSNLGNVFFEIFSVGAVVLGLNDGSLNEYLHDAINGYLIEDEQQACKIILNLLENITLKEKLSKNAISFARKHFLSLDKRFGMEVDLIESTAFKNSK
jgi:glycosyltransferase involved in cell wall biosynthesis